MKGEEKAPTTHIDPHRRAASNRLVLPTVMSLHIDSVLLDNVPAELSVCLRRGLQGESEKWKDRACCKGTAGACADRMSVGFGKIAFVLVGNRTKDEMVSEAERNRERKTYGWGWK